MQSATSRCDDLLIVRVPTELKQQFRKAAQASGSDMSARMRQLMRAEAALDRLENAERQEAESCR